MSKEAQARIKINQLLEAAGWRFFDTAESSVAAHHALHEGLTKIAQGPRCRIPKAKIQKRLNLQEGK